MIVERDFGRWAMIPDSVRQAKRLPASAFMRLKVSIKP